MKGSSRSFYIIAVFYLPPSLSHASAPLQLVTSLIPCSPLVSMNNTYASRQGVVFTDFVLKAKYSAAGEQVNTCLSILVVIRAVPSNMNTQNKKDFDGICYTWQLVIIWTLDIASKGTL